MDRKISTAVVVGALIVAAAQMVSGLGTEAPRYQFMPDAGYVLRGDVVSGEIHVCRVNANGLYVCRTSIIPVD